MPNVQLKSSNTSKECKVYVVEDHARLRRLLVAFLRQISRLQIIGQAASGEEALADPGHLEADLVITDLSMPGMSGIELSRCLCAEKPDFLVIILTAHDEQYLIDSAFEAGASAFVLKDDPFVLEDVIMRLLAGEKRLVSLAN